MKKCHYKLRKYVNAPEIQFVPQYTAPDLYIYIYIYIYVCMYIDKYSSRSNFKIKSAK